MVINSMGIEISVIEYVILGIITFLSINTMYGIFDIGFKHNDTFSDRLFTQIAALVASGFWPFVLPFIALSSAGFFFSSIGRNVKLKYKQRKQIK